MSRLFRARSICGIFNKYQRRNYGIRIDIRIDVPELSDKELQQVIENRELIEIKANRLEKQQYRIVTGFNRDFVYGMEHYGKEHYGDKLKILIMFLKQLLEVIDVFYCDFVTFLRTVARDVMCKVIKNERIPVSAGREMENMKSFTEYFDYLLKEINNYDELSLTTIHKRLVSNLKRHFNVEDSVIIYELYEQFIKKEKYDRSILNTVMVTEGDWIVYDQYGNYQVKPPIDTHVFYYYEEK